MPGDAHLQQLVGAQAQHVQQRRVDLLQRAVHAGGEDRVQAALGAQRAVEQLGGEGGVAAGDLVGAQQAGQHQVRVGVLLPHQAQPLEGDLTGGGGAARALGGAGVRVAAAGAALAAGAGAGAALLVAGASVAVPSAAGVAASSFLAHAVSPSCWSVVKRATSGNAAPRAQSAARIGRL